MISYPILGTVAMVVVVVGVIASLVALGVIAHFLVSERRERLARHESVRTHYRRLVATH
ncbi:MAG TPA: hypothetical protein VD864_01470 [Nocardioides sp.]|nr:hypothetical protein [Nocardioides sp.]